MQSTKQLKIYISAMEAVIDGRPQFDITALNLLERLKTAGCALYWNKTWRSYEIIEQEIASCDCLIALVDCVWTSSTWMAIEASWAAGAGGSGLTNNKPIDPITVFIYPIDDSWKKTFLKSLPNIICLDREIEKAIPTIFDKMGYRPA